METVGAKQGNTYELSIDSEHHETPVTIVPQLFQPVSGNRETMIVSAKGEDVSKWRKYASTYYARSKSSKEETTRDTNRETYLHYKALLETAGYSIEEGTATIVIHEPKKATA